MPGIEPGLRCCLLQPTPPRTGFKKSLELQRSISGFEYLAEDYLPGAAIPCCSVKPRPKRVTIIVKRKASYNIGSAANISLAAAVLDGVDGIHLRPLLGVRGIEHRTL